MANIGVRSPYFVYAQETGTVDSLPASYATMSLSIGGTEQYQITKNTGTEFLIDIAELVRDFIAPNYSGSLVNSTADVKSVSYTITFYNSAGTAFAGPATGSHTAFDGYNYFSDGNATIPVDTVLLSESVVWYPQNTTGTFFVTGASSGLTTPISFASTATQLSGISIKRLSCSKYDAYKLVFVNKFGVLQELFFNGRTNTSVSSSGEKYKSGYISSNGTIDTNRHQFVDYNKNGKLSYTLNTTYLSEEINTYIQELLLSEYVWLVKDSNIHPVNVISSSVQYKTELNDKLVNYTIEVEQANDLISTVR